MRKTILATIGCFAVGINGALGVCNQSPLFSVPSGYNFSYSNLTYSSNYGYCNETTTGYYCNDSTRTCMAIVYCNTCQSGYTIDTVYKVQTNYLNICDNSLAFQDCCQPCADCGYRWNMYFYKYEQGTYKTCEPCSTNCTTTTVYRCNNGFYGTASAGGAGCYECPSDASGNKGYSEKGTTSITGCYIQSGKNFSDFNGKGVYSANCYYVR